MPTAPTRSLFAAGLALALWLGLAGVASAESRALLIGVGAYPQMPVEYRMTAPALDVQRVGAALVAAGLDAEQVVTLSDGVDGRAVSRAAVLAALSDLAARSATGDRVLIYFSGHGGQKTATFPQQEADGLEEVWLMSDAALDVDPKGRRNGTARLASGYVADYEIGEAVARLRARGIDVWLVVDACYAGGVTRGEALVEGVVVKSVGLGRGAPRSAKARSADRVHPAVASAHEADHAASQMGGFAAFYAAGDDGLALATPVGSVFSNALARALDAGRTHSFRDLAAGLMSVDGRMGPDAPRPVFEGDLDRPVLNLAPGAQRRFAVRRMGEPVQLAAGREEGVDDGDAVVFEDAAGQVLGRGKVAKAGLGQSRLKNAPTMAIAARLAPRLHPAKSAGERVLAAISALDGGWSSGALAIEARLERPEREACATLVDPQSPGMDATPVSLFDLPALRDCDRLFISLTNTGATPLDVNLLYLANDGSVVGPSLHPFDDVRLRCGEHRDAAIRLVSEAGPVMERIAIIAIPARSRFPLDLRYLSTPAERGGDDALAEWLADLIGGETTRGAGGGASVAPPANDALVAVAFPVRVVP